MNNLENERRLAQSLDRMLTAVVSNDTLDGLLSDLVRIFVEAAGADVAVLRLREADRLRSRAAVGLEDEVASGFSCPVDEDLRGRAPDGGQRGLRPFTMDASRVSAFARKQAIPTFYCQPLADGELVGAVYLGMLEHRELSDDTRLLLDTLGNRAAAAIAHCSGIESLGEKISSRDHALEVVAHDLNNPISVISVTANTLLERLADSSSRRPIERIIRASLRASRLVGNLLEINAMEGGRFSIERHRVEPADLVLSALESQQSLAADASVIIASDLSAELPAMEADAERLLEVLENLVGNAVKFTGPGGSITVGAAPRNDEVLLWVKDSGAGISVEQLPHIFDRFWQAKKSRPRGTGVGLGLAICKGIVDEHGGRIWVESTLGVGTTVFFTIPARAALAQPPEDVEVANILLVDDRPDNLLSLKAILERPDYRLVTASSGEEALRAALRDQFAVVLLDVAMPIMNGLEVAGHLKELERSRDTPIIFITAFGNDPEEIHRAYSAGGADYLVKPLDAEIVRRKVSVFVDLSRRRRGIDRPS